MNEKRVSAGVSIYEVLRKR